MEEEKDREEIEIERTTGSVFAALGFPDAEEMERKSRLVTVLNNTIEALGLTQVEAAKIVGIDQPTLSKLLRGRTRSISTDKLTDMLNSLGRDVTIVVGSLREKGRRDRGHTSVIETKDNVATSF